MSRHNPKNKMEAFTHQFEDTTKLLMSLAVLNDRGEYLKQLQLLKEQIQTFENQTGN